MTILKCLNCKKQFEKPHVKGPKPKYCKAACRQDAFRKRHSMSKEEQVQLFKEALIEQYKWFSGKIMQDSIAHAITERLYEIGWRKTNA